MTGSRAVQRGYRGYGDEPIMLMSIGRCFGWWAERDPNGVAVREGDRSITRLEFEVASNRLARVYRDCGVGVDDLVSVGLGNGIDFYLSCAGIWKAGGIPQPLSSRLPEPELSQILELGQPKLVIGLPKLGGGQSALIPAGFEPSESISDAPLQDVHASSWKAPVSGGSTGVPKIIFSGTPATVDPDRPTVSYIPAKAIQLVGGPVHHSAPFLFSMRGLFIGHTLVVLPRFDAEAALQAIQTHRVSWALLVPTMMQRIWRLDPTHRESFDVSSLAAILHLGAPCPQWLKRAWIQWLGPDRIWEIYAGTESAGVTLIGGRDWLEHPGSVGRPAPGFSFTVLGQDDRPLPADTIGEIYMRPARGVGSTYRYVGAKSRRVQDWESIGDLGWIDAAGYVYLADRSSDVILSRGVTVYPAQIEAAIDSHHTVRSSAVIGLPAHADTGTEASTEDQIVHAVVDVADNDTTEADLRAWLRGRLSDGQMPETIEFVTEPVRDDAGKIRRQALRQQRL